MTGYRIQIPPTTELHRREIELRMKQLAEFGAAVGWQETWFEGYDAILTYLNDTVGVRNQHGRRIKKNILVLWHRKYEFPLLKMNRTIRSCNFKIMAWLWAWRVYRATRRYKPRTWDLVNATAHLV